MVQQMNLRQTEISNILNSEQEVSVQDLAERFGVSQMTIRRDLSFLESQGLAVRHHGGAMLAGKLRFLRGAFPEQAESPGKRALGRVAATLVSEGETVMVDSSATTFEVALQLPPDIGITLATTSLGIAQALYGSGMSILVLGGFLREDNPSVYGPLTEQSLAGLTVDTLFVGCDGADSSDGFYMADLYAASLEQAMIHAAHRVVVVTASAAFARRSFARYAVPQQVQYVVTDAGLSPRDRANLEERGVTVLIGVDGGDRQEPGHN